MLDRKNFTLKGKRIYRDGKLIAVIAGHRSHYFAVLGDGQNNVDERYPAPYVADNGDGPGPVHYGTFAYFDDAVRNTINELIARDARAKGEI